MIIDDEQDVCTVLKEALEYEGYQADFVLSGDEAIERIEGTQYQALLVDIRLSGSTSGIHVIRHCGKLAERPAILVISATPKNLLDPIFEQEGISNLVERILEKPSELNPDVAPGLVREVLKKWKRGQVHGE